MNRSVNILSLQLSFSALILIAFFAGPATVLAEKTKAKMTEIILSTSTKGGGFELFGNTLADVVNQTSKKVKIKAIPTKGSKQNLPFLESGKIHIGLVEGNAARLALDGVNRPKVKLKVLYVMYPNPGMFVVRKDSKYKSISDLKGKPIAFGTKASGLRILSTDVLSGLNLRPAHDFKQIILSKAAQGPKLVLDKKAEALWGAGIGWPGFVKVANSGKGARFIAPSAAEIKRILGKHPHLKPMTVPAGTYKGQDKPINSVGLWSLILIRPNVSNEDAYQLARAIHQSQKPLAKRLKQAGYTKASNTVKHVPKDRIHPGALKYFKEAKLIP